MATGDVADMAWRIYTVLPQRWFPALELAPVLNGLLSGLGAAWAFCFSLLAYARGQARISTASGSFLDMIAADYFGLALRRRFQEDDAAFRSRILANLLREQGTRAAVSAAVLSQAGSTAVVFEPGRPADTGGYGSIATPAVGGGAGYGIRGLAYGSLQLPFSFLVSVVRSSSAADMLQVGGYGSLRTGAPTQSSGGYGMGALEYVAVSSLQGVVSDDDIRAAVVSAIPVNTTAWLALQ